MLVYKPKSKTVITAQVKAELESICPQQVFYDVDLSQLSRWGVGGLADCVVRPTTEKQVIQLIKLFHQQRTPFLVIGATSNLLFADEGLRPVCIQISSLMSNVRIDGENVYAQAGVWVPGFARKLMLAGLTGAEHISGIPGTLGGLLCMNGGSQRKGIGLNVESITSVTTSGELVTRDNDACQFGYRSSVFQTNQEIILSAIFKFSRSADKREVRREMLSILRSRRGKFPQKLPNCGSVFKSNPAMYAEVGPPGEIIEKLGFKGLSCGGAQVSKQHANFIVNTGQCRAHEVIFLIQKIAATVESHTGYMMEPEAGYVCATGQILNPLRVQPGDS